MLDAHHFGRQLRVERERRGISLESIVIKTKIRKAYLTDLENGDLSNWPIGEVFRRAYVRDYATAVGLSPESVFADFVSVTSHGEPLAVEQTPLALTFDTAPHWYATLTSRRALATAVDVIALLLIGALCSLIAGGSTVATAGVIALVYFPLTTALLGRGLSCWFLDNYQSRRQGLAIRRMASLDEAPRMFLDPASDRAPLRAVPSAAPPSETLIDSLFLVPDTSRGEHATSDAPVH